MRIEITAANRIGEAYGGNRVIMTTIEQLAGLTAQHNELVKRVVKGSLDPEAAKRGLHDTIMGKVHSVPSWYVSPTVQRRIVKAHLKPEWGIEKVPPVPPRYEPRTSTEVLMLNLRLPRQLGQSGPIRTLKQLWALIEPPQNYTKHGAQELMLPYELRQEKFYPGEKGLEWIVFDPCAYQGLSPEDARERARVDGLWLAGTEVLMAAWLFPDWIANFRAESMPPPWLAGIQVNEKDYGGWSSAPFICCHGYEVGVAYGHVGWSLNQVASPAFRDV